LKRSRLARRGRRQGRRREKGEAFRERRALNVECRTGNGFLPRHLAARVLELGMDEILYRRAKARVEERLGFYRHATIYVAVNLFLLALNWYRSPDHWWAMWSVLGWGIGLASHGVQVFSSGWGSSRKEGMIRREMEREARERASRQDQP
jgi:hypothetical protein